jgi:translation initiation factor 2B subunit (eIF-2B alpha/beta/delta family)
MLSNGNLLGEVGTALISCIAYNFKKPVIAFSETYKFWDKIMMNSFQTNNMQVDTNSENSVNF